jgi:hypothetical protein
MPTCGLPDINLRPSRTKMTPQTSNMTPNRPYFDVLAAKWLLVAYSRSRGHSNTQHSDIPRLRRKFVRAFFSGLNARVARLPVSRAPLARATLATDREECTPAFLPSFSSSLLFSPLSSPPFSDHIFEFPTWGAGIRASVRL